MLENKDEKSAGEKLKEKLFYKRESGYLSADKKVIDAAYSFCEGYKSFLNNGMTERLCVKESIGLAENAGFRPFQPEVRYSAGDRFYMNNRGKSLIMGIIGKNGCEGGLNIAAAHIDSPRLDLKQCPVYEDKDMVLFKTHYYGGIKKYQWTALPLELHGVVIKEDGTSVEVSVGHDESEPIFTITDLLPHLAKDQVKKPIAEAFTGEDLNVLAGSAPYGDEKLPEAIKLNLLNILYKKYGITESDLMSAELCFVPNYKARDLGFDRSFIGSYGQDDRVCAYTSLIAFLDQKGTPERTLILILADKEETGSDGTTGMRSAAFESVTGALAFNEGVRLQSVFDKSRCLSADVNAGVDPNYPEVSELRNASFLNCGAVLTKYTGARGKSDTSDASAEFFGFVRGVMDKANVLWQTGELGKCDQGGGGTVAKYLANRNIDTLDLGVSVLSMHSPFEVTAKLDIYMTYRAVYEFLKTR